MLRIPFITPKGGVGKTTSTANLAAALWERGYRVLMVDVEPQADLTVTWGVNDADAGVVYLEQLLPGGLDPREHVVDCTPDETAENRLWLLPASRDLNLLQARLVKNSYRDLARLLEAFEDVVDIALIDTPGGDTPFGESALACATDVIVPARPGFHELRAAQRFLADLEERGQPVNLLGVLFVDADARWVSTREYREHLASEGIPTFKTLVRQRVRVSDDPRFGRPTFLIDPDGDIAQDYRAVALELIAQLTTSEEAVDAA